MTTRRWQSAALAGALVALAVIVLGGAVWAAGTPGGASDPPGLSTHSQQEILARLAADTARLGAVEGDEEWSRRGGPVEPGGRVLGLAVHPTLPGTLYAAVSPAGISEIGPSTIYGSTDGAASWTPLFTAPNEVNCLAAAGNNLVAGAFPHWAGDGAAVYSSQDGGATWSEALSLDSRAVLIDVAFDPADANRAIIGGLHNDENWWEDGVVYGTTDGGATWNLLLQVSVPDQHAVIMAVLISPHDPSLMLASLRGDGPDDTRVYRSTDGGHTWGSAAHIPGVHVARFLAHPTDPQVIYAGTDSVTHAWGPSQVYRSPDAGQTWDLVLPDAGGPLAFLPPSTVVTAWWGQIWASPSNGDLGTWAPIGGLWDGAQRLGADLGSEPAALYAGLSGAGVAKSTDGGGTWTPQASGMAASAVLRDVTVDPSNGSRILAASRAGRGWRSEDGGATWAPVLDQASGVADFDFEDGDPAVAYAASSACSGPVLWRSEDHGASFAGAYTPAWFQPDCSGGGEDLAAVAVAPSNPLRVYAAGEAYPAGQDRQAVVVRSLNGGLSWTEGLVGPQGSGFWVVAVSPQNPQVVFAGGYDRSAGPWTGVIYRTEDGGASWEQVLTGEENTIVASIAVDPADPQVVYAGCEGGYDVYKSGDGGDTWQMIRSNRPPFNAPSGSLVAIDPHDHNRVYLAGWGYVAESPDGGATWSEWDAPINRGMPPVGPQSLAVDNGDPVQTLYLGIVGLWAHSRPAPIAGDRYVATSGDDAMNTCADPAQPCRTVGRAVAQARAGETVRVAHGTYLENLALARSVSIEGGYSGPPGWERDLGLYETVLDGSGQPAEPGEFDGDGAWSPSVVFTGSQYEMWYTGIDRPGTTRLGRASGGPTAWTKSPQNPLLDGSEGAVRRSGGGYRLWYTRYDTNCLHYAESPDGLAWTEWPDPLLCALYDGSWEGDGLADPTIAVDGSGTYWMFYEGFNWSAANPVQIGCATSPDGLAWTRCAGNPVVSPGAAGAWDDDWVLDPEVLVLGDSFRMWYQGVSSTGPRAIGLATSPDGLNWTRQAGNPVLEGTPGAWDEGQVRSPALRFSATGYQLWYASRGRLGYAESSDGIAWAKHPDPVLDKGQPGAQGAPTVHIHAPWQGAQRPPRSWRPGTTGGVQVSLDGLTVTGGTYWRGAGVTVENANATLRAVRVAGNHAWGEGGGIGVFGASGVQIVSSEIADNSAEQWGGGLFAEGGTQVALTDVTVHGNQSVHGEGGGLAFTGQGTEAHLLRVAVTDNQADGAGGITLSGDPGPVLTLDTVAISHNTARWAGGLRPYHSTVDGDRVWMVDNAATDDDCGGFNADTSAVSLTNVLIAGNAGGAGCAWGGTLTLMNATVAGNTRGGPAGVWVGGSGSAAVTNGILFFNGDADLECEEGSSCTVRFSDVEHAWAGTGNISQDPLFGADYHLTADSPARDSATWSGAPDHDLDGDARPFRPGQPAFDMGADEFWPTPGLVLTALTPLQQRGAPGHAVVYRFRLTNTGDDGDSFDLAVSGHAWPTALSAASSGELEPGEASEFQVTVQVPAAGALLADPADSFTLEAVSGWPPHPSATRVGTTTAGGARICLPVVVRSH